MSRPPRLLPVLACRCRASPDGLRPAQGQRVTERTLRGPVLEQRGGHKIIVPSLAVLSPRTCSESVAELATGVRMACTADAGKHPRSCLFGERRGHRVLA